MAGKRILDRVAVNMKLTQKIILKLPRPAAGHNLYFDSETRGMGVRVTAGGCASSAGLAATRLRPDWSWHTSAARLPIFDCLAPLVNYSGFHYSICSTIPAGFNSSTRQNQRYGDGA